MNMIAKVQDPKSVIIEATIVMNLGDWIIIKDSLMSSQRINWNHTTSNFITDIDTVIRKMYTVVQGGDGE